MMQAMESWLRQRQLHRNAQGTIAGPGLRGISAGFTEVASGTTLPYCQCGQARKGSAPMTFNCWTGPLAGARGGAYAAYPAGRSLERRLRVYVVANDALKGWDFPENDALCDELKRESVGKRAVSLCGEALQEYRLGGGSQEQDIRYISTTMRSQVYTDLKHCPRQKMTGPVSRLCHYCRCWQMRGYRPWILRQKDDGFEYVGTWCPTVRSV